MSEGLAECYEEQVGCGTPNYALAVQGPTLARLVDRASAELHSVSYNHPRWLYGCREQPEVFPWSGGYSLGYLIVRHWLGRHCSTPSNAVNVSADDFLSGFYGVRTSLNEGSSVPDNETAQ